MTGTDRQTYRWTGRKTDAWRQTDRCIDDRLDRQPLKDGRMRQNVRQTDRQTDREMDGWA